MQPRPSSSSGARCSARPTRPKSNWPRPSAGWCPAPILFDFANSGSEAICGAIRAARGFTGKSKLLKFEGHYHGWVDVLAVSNRPALADAGPAASVRTALPIREEFPAASSRTSSSARGTIRPTLRSVLDAHDGQLAAVIAEPIVANNACIMPVPGLFGTAPRRMHAARIVLIFDEIVTGFRLAAGGAQEFFGVVPDIAVFSKALGGGFPISAFAGIRKVMEPIGANTVKHGGTYNGNSLCAAAALGRVLRHLAQPECARRVRRRGERVIEAIRRAAHDHSVPCCVQGDGTMFQVVFSAGRPTAEQLSRVARRRYARYAQFQPDCFYAGVCTSTPAAAPAGFFAPNTTTTISRWPARPSTRVSPI